MKFNKKFIGLFLSLGIISTVFAGCTAKDVEAVRAASPEEAMELFNKYNVENNVEEMVKLYSDVYIDSVGYNTGKIITLLKNNRKGAEITKSQTVSMEDVSDSIKKAVVDMAIIENKEEVPYSYDYAVIKEEDGWAVSPDGVIGSTDFEVPQSKKDEFNLNLAKIIQTIEGSIIRVNIENDTSSPYKFGGEGNFCNVVVETTEGTYTTVMDEEVELPKKTQTYFMAKFDKIEGEVTKVTLTNIYDVKDDSLVSGSGREIIVYQK